MKERKNIYLFLLLIFVLCISTSTVYARTLWAICSYDFEPAGHSRKTLYFSLYDTGELTMPSQYVFDPDYESYSLFYHNQFTNKFKNELYSDGKVSASCPSIQTCSSSESVTFYMDQPSCSGGRIQTLNGKLTVYGTGEGTVSQKEDKSRTFCTEKKSLRNQSYNVEIKFFLDSDGNRKFSIYKEGTTDGGEADANGRIWIGTNSFELDQNDVEKYFNSSTCSSTDKYFDLQGSNENIIITSSEPADYNNGEAKPKDSDKETVSNNDSDNATPLVDFCNEEKAQNALRFIGYLLLVVKILVPILLIVFGVVDYFKAVVSSDSDAIGKSTKSLIMRVIAGVIIFIIPTIVNFVFGLVPNNSSLNNIDKCRTCVFSPNKC